MGEARAWSCRLSEPMALKKVVSPHVQCKSRHTAQIGAAGDNHKSPLLIATISLAYRIGKAQRRDVRSAANP